MALYTVVVDYLGGTYIEQVTAADLQGVVNEWARKAPLDLMGVQTTTTDQLLEIMRDVDSQPVPINDVVNVWCTTPLLDDEPAQLNIIKTSTDP